MLGPRETFRSKGLRIALIGKVVGLAVLMLGGVVRPAAAIPTPGGFSDDAGATLFTPLSDPFFAIEVSDLLGSVGAASEFGFYLPSAPGSLVPIFDSSDQGPPDQVALISLSGGLVVDADAGAAQGTFPALASDSTIGFYLTLFQGTPDELTLFTDPLLNPGGGDFAQAFQSLSDDTFFVNFEDFGTATSLGQYIISPIAVAVISEPSALALFAAALLGLFVLPRRSRLRFGSSAAV
ncbi:MAG: hypothetical protein CMM50_04580 [Rhodospirillaceae bacterium]|nr:hypothetical protein [Rhodospirillaceae bacterium]|tara:strand:- start:1961 stop:2671 length:711 start_codon:yes stop_codon:yes gene_type:complete